MLHAIMRHWACVVGTTLVLAISSHGQVKTNTIPADSQNETKQAVPDQQFSYNMCGPYSVFVTSALHGTPLPLSQCVKAVPVKSAGNTMAELKRGYEQLGFRVQAVAIRPDVFSQKNAATFVAWIPPSMEIRTPSGKIYTSGHYVVLHKRSDAKWLLLDYPVAANTINPESWLASILSENQLEELPALIITGKANPRIQSSNNNTPQSNKDLKKKILIDELDHGTTSPQVRAPNAGFATADVFIDKTPAHLSSAKLDFGPRVQGEQLEGMVWIWNNSDSVLELDNIQSTCGCTVGVLDQRTLQPGDKAQLKINMSLVGRKGQVRQSVSMIAKSNNETIPVFIECTALSAPQWKLQPKSISFGEVSSNGQSVQKRVIVQASFPSIADKLTKAIGSTTGLKATILDAQSNPSKGTYAIVVTFTTDKSMIEYYSGQIQIFGEEDDLMTALTIPVTAHIQ